MTFTWDPEKDAVNRRKHAVGFGEAASSRRPAGENVSGPGALARRAAVCDDRTVEAWENARGGARGPRRHASHHQRSAGYAARTEVL